MVHSLPILPKGIPGELVEGRLVEFEVHERSGMSGYEPVVQQKSGVVSSIPGCPNLELNLDALWAKAAELGE
jgi:hypothetical protein